MEGEKGTVTLSGTLFGNSMPRLVKFNEYQLEGYLDGNLLVIDHQDKPGVIGSLGVTLGKRSLNISSMSVGRLKTSHKPGKYHIGVLSLDEEPNAETLAEIKSMDAVANVYAVKLPAADDLPVWMG